MGEAKKRQYSRHEFLTRNPNCIYCGKHADTTEHCPPRCFFIGRAWPEHFEYPACRSCNEAARLDDQALAVLTRVRFQYSNDPTYQAEYKALVDAVANNSPDLVREWVQDSAVVRKRSMRQILGRDTGDRLRLEGWGAAHLGPISEQVIHRFMVRLGQSLYFHHTDQIFSGTMYTRHVSLLQTTDPEEFMKAALSIAPSVSSTTRAGKSLHEQFSYFFNVGPHDQAFYSVVQFNQQFIFMILAFGPKMTTKMNELGYDYDKQFGTKTLIER